MQAPVFPENELQRLQALRERTLLDTPDEERFDRLTRLAQQMFGCQIALVSLVDAKRQWFKSRQGLDACETGRDVSFCGHAILGDEIFLVADASKDMRFADNPLVTGGPCIRFYAGAPLRTADGYRIGTLCIIDAKPRHMTEQELHNLRDLADCVENEINQVEIQQQKQALNQFKSTLDRTLDCVFMFDAKTLLFFYANQGALLQVGYSLDELRSMHPYDIKPEISETQFHTLIVPLLSGAQASLTFETVHQHKNGQRMPVEIFLQYIAPVGEQARFVVIVRDITERKLAETERDRIANFLNNILEAASEVSIIASDPQGLITTFNRGAERLLGYSAEEMVGKQSPAIIHLPDEVVARGKELSAKLNRPIEGFRIFVDKAEREGSEKRDWTYVHKSGRQIPVSLVVTTMRSSRGEIIGYLGIADDISERKQAETAMREQAQHTQAILDNMVDGIITIDEAGIIHSFNPAAEHIFGYLPEQVMGQNVKMLMPNPNRDAHDSYLRNYQSTGVARIIGIGREVEGQRKDGSLFPMDLAISEITHQGKPMYIGMVRDITERKRAERMKSEFVSTVSRELRTPLTAISGALGLVASGTLGEMQLQARQMIEIAYKNSQRLTHLINDLLDMEKIAAGKLHFDMQGHSLLPMIEQALEANRAYSAERKVTLALRGDVPAVVVRVDSQRLMQVLSNLLSNAIKYSPQAGQVEIDVEQRDTSVRVTVNDHGPGIPAEFRARIFQKFAQADSSDTRQKGGTGLGLAITRELVERMGGRIGFDSTEGQGSRFYFELPLWSAQEGATSAANEKLLADDALHILVVEDEPDVAQLLGLMFTRAGYAVDIAITGAQALEALQNKRYAAMSLDLMLPDISGLEIIRWARQRQETQDMPIVVVSAKMEEGRLAINGDFSGIDWLGKPIDEGRLLAVVDRQLAHVSEERPRVLHVEDDVDLHQIVRGMVDGRFDFELATTLHEARARVALERFDAVILDLILPDGSGWDLLPMIRLRQPGARVIILSGADMTLEQARKVDAVLSKSRVTPQELIAAMNARIRFTKP